MNKPICIIAGVGEGNGYALAREHERKGYFVIALSRNISKLEALFGGINTENVAAIACDLSNTDSIHSMYQSVLENHGKPSLLIYNAGNALFDSIDNVNINDCEMAWKLNCSGLLSLSQCMLPDLESASNPGIIVIGATASLRGTAKTLSFSSAKSAQRAMVQSMAKTLWPRGIHVSYVIIDGVIKTSITSDYFPDKDDNFFIHPESLAKRISALSEQDKSAWAFEIDIRPFKENW